MKIKRINGCNFKSYFFNCLLSIKFLVFNFLVIHCDYGLYFLKCILDKPDHFFRVSQVKIIYEL